MQTNLYISSNALTAIISSLIIKEKHPNDRNILMVVTNHIESKFIESMADIAKKLNCFSEVYMFNEFSEGIRLNTNISLKQMKEFNFRKFEEKIGTSEFDNIYSTNFYIHSKIIIGHYEKARIHLLENGTASYFKGNFPQEFISRVDSFYSFNYFGTFIPEIVIEYPHIKNIVVDKQKTVEVFKYLSEFVDIQEDEKSVLFLAHNLALVPNYVTEDEEFEEYKQIIQIYLDQGYTIYFKNHPKTPMFYYDKLKKMNSSKIKNLKDNSPIEIIIPKLKPKMVVGLFSTALLTSAYFYDLPTYTFETKMKLAKMKAFSLAHAMVNCYIPKIGGTFPVSDIKLHEHPLYQLVMINLSNKFIDRKTFRMLQEKIQTFDYSDFRQFEVPELLFNVFKNGSYWNYLDYFAEPFTKIIKQQYKDSTKKEFFIKAVKVFAKFFN
jgi:hypothetical protein